MLRITDKLIKKIYSTDLSRNELITLIELIKKSNIEGNAEIYYKEFVKNISGNVATLYNCLNSLEKKGFIDKCKNANYKKELEIGIIDADFSHVKNCYVKINNNFLMEKEYKKLSAGQIRVMLYLIFRTCKAAYNEDVDSPQHNKNKHYYKDNYKSIAKQLGITKRMAKIYVKELVNKKLICVAEKQINRRLDIITVAHKLLSTYKVKLTERGITKDKAITELHSYRANCIINFCRRYNKEIRDKLTLDNTAELMLQYQNQAAKRGKDIYTLMQSAIKNTRGAILNSKTAHAILRTLLDRQSLLVCY